MMWANLWAERQIRTQMTPADPARAVPVPPPSATATELIARAEAGTASPVRRRPVVARRPLLAGAAAAAAVLAVVTYALAQPEPDRPGELPGPGVVVPIAYEITEDPPPAADYLRDLAAQITDAPYDEHTGAYAYLHTRTWGQQGISHDDYVAKFVSDSEYWLDGDGDGTGTVRYTTVGVEYPDEESRRYWEAHLEPDYSEFLETAVSPYSREEGLSALEYVAPGETIPTDPELRIDQMIGVHADGVLHFGNIEVLYEQHLVPRELRAAVLVTLADVPGVVWRGAVTDRAGRNGVAVTYDYQDFEGGQPAQHVLVFDPRTGELLSREIVWPAVDGVNLYTLFLDAGWTDDPGPGPAEPSPTP